MLRDWQQKRQMSCRHQGRLSMIIKRKQRQQIQEQKQIIARTLAGLKDSHGAITAIIIMAETLMALANKNTVVVVPLTV
jgi:hypothetical protein